MAGTAIPKSWRIHAVEDDGERGQRHESLLIASPSPLVQNAADINGDGVHDGRISTAELPLAAPFSGSGLQPASAVTTSTTGRAFFIPASIDSGPGIALSAATAPTGATGMELHAVRPHRLGPDRSGPSILHGVAGDFTLVPDAKSLRRMPASSSACSGPRPRSPRCHRAVRVRHVHEQPGVRIRILEFLDHAFERDLPCLPRT